MLQDQR